MPRTFSFLSRITSSLLGALLLCIALVLIGCNDNNGLDQPEGNGETVMMNDAPDETVVDILMTDTRFTMLTTAIDSADMITQLRDESFITIFAPTNDAFDQLPEGTYDELLQDTDRLEEILGYHVVSTELRSDDFEDGDTFETMEGSEITINVDGQDYFANEAELIERDIEAGNGVIHVINNVLRPPE